MRRISEGNTSNKLQSLACRRCERSCLTVNDAAASELHGAHAAAVTLTGLSGCVSCLFSAQVGNAWTWR